MEGKWLFKRMDTQGGIFRNDKYYWDGRVRHSIYFSITDEEWPRVKADLEAKLARPYPST